MTLKSSRFQRVVAETVTTNVRWDDSKAPPVGPVQLPNFLQETQKQSNNP